MPTLSVDPEFVIPVRSTGGFRASEPRRGPIQTGATHENRPRRWQMRWKAAVTSIKDDIEAALDSTLGGAGTMDWTPPDESQLKVRFLKGREGYNYNQFAPDLFEITVGLEEALGTE